MKIDLIKALIAFAISGLIAFGFYTFSSDLNRDLLTIGSLIFLSVTLIFSISISNNLPRTTTLIRITSIIFFIIALISNLLFLFIKFSQEVYIIVNGIMLLIYGLISYSIAKAKQ